MTLLPPVPSSPAALSLARRPRLGDALGLEQSVNELRWDAQAVPLMDRAKDPSLQLTNRGATCSISPCSAQFDIPLRSDPNERTNILLSANAVDGVEVDPGQIFSFNGVVGERTPAARLPGRLDVRPRRKLIRGTGGGICLVATGLYNAALRAGMGVVERHPHSGLVSYAPPGCDAGVVYGVEDMKFQNTTDFPLMVKSQTADDHITLQLFGHAMPPGEEVVVKPTAFTPLPAPTIQTIDPTLLPGQSVVDQKPRAGFDVTVTRFWTEHHQVIRQEIIAQERRAPRPELVRIAPPLTISDPLATLLLGGPMPEIAPGN